MDVTSDMVNVRECRCRTIAVVLVAGTAPVHPPPGVFNFTFSLSLDDDFEGLRLEHPDTLQSLKALCQILAKK